MRGGLILARSFVYRARFFFCQDRISTSVFRGLFLIESDNIEFFSLYELSVMRKILIKHVVPSCLGLLGFLVFFNYRIVNPIKQP